MSHQLTRRDFLKISAAFSLSGALNSLPIQRRDLFRMPSPRMLESGKPKLEGVPNIIVIIFDALSAMHLSTYEYPRQTSPNLERFASQATVFHNHHSAGNFTTPSTASLFSGTYPWTHRAYNLSSLISPQVQPNNLFAQLDPLYYQAAYTQNTFADMLLYQFQKHLDRHEAVDWSSLAGRTFYDNLFRRDAIYGMKSMDQLLFKREEAHGSLFLSILNDLTTQLSYQVQSARLKDIYQNGPPRLANTDVYIDLAMVMDSVMGLLDELPKPHFTYLHLMPPHMPYTPTREFLGMFDDGWVPLAKKKHRLAPGVKEERLNELRQTYDEFIANLDAEFGRLMDHMKQTGLLDDSYVIFTSDHGEMFERGASGHSLPLVFEPGIRIPLIISAPGQTERRDVRQLTSNVDLLPSFLNIAGLDIPLWCEGQPLPGLGGEEDNQRGIYVVEAKANPAYGPLRKATLAIIRGQYKLVHYLGYKYYPDNYEFYDLKNDPDELQNLYPDHPGASELQAELDQKLSDYNLQNQTK